MNISNRYLLLLLALVALAGILVYSWFDPEQYILFPKCLFRTLTGWDCPGCGSQRAIHSALHGEFAKAYGYNPLLILSIPYLVAAFYLEFLNGKQRFSQWRKILMGRNACIVILCIILIYWVGRNVM